MATILRMPDLGTVEGQVTLVRWLKAEGDTVAVGEPLFEVETDKGVSEVEAAIGGVLVRRVLAEGGRAGPGETIALIRRPGDPEGEDAAAGAPAPGPAASRAPAPGPFAAPPGAAPQPGPSIRALAERYGVDLSRVKATGPGGRITRQDVLAARGAPPGAAPAAGAPASMPPAALSGPLALSRGQSIIARKVSQSHAEKPAYHVTAQVDMGRALALRERARASGKGLSWDAILVKAAALAMEEFPVFRRWFRRDELAEHPAADAALAIGVEEDLYVPVVRGAARTGIEEVSTLIDALVKKAQARALGAEEMEGGCFLVSNLGMFPIESFDAIIYPEHSAALAVGAVTAVPVSDGEKIWIARRASLTLSVDHRLINGKTAAQFLARLSDILEKGTFA
jgi:pyruvate dehydrogenase E2 component (dihydrolipoamide acetyltransferase)